MSSTILKHEDFHYDANNLISFTEEHDPDVNQFCKHCHTGYEILFLLNGEIDMQIEDMVFSMQKNDIVIIKPTLYHVATVKTDNLYSRCVINVIEQYLEGIGLEKLARLFDTLPSYCFSLTEHSFLLQHYLKSAELISKMPAEEERKHILDGLLFSIYAAFSTNDSLECVDQLSPLSPMTRKVLEFIEGNIAKELTLSSIAEHLLVSKSHMSNLFGSEMGIGIKHYITQKRVLMAKAMLDRGVPVKEAYLKCGYHEYSTFYRAYRAVLGTNPVESRSRCS